MFKNQTDTQSHKYRTNECKPKGKQQNDDEKLAWNRCSAFNIEMIEKKNNRILMVTRLKKRILSSQVKLSNNRKK